MRPQVLRLLVLLVSVVLVSATAWTKEDYEIFKLRDEVVAAEGSDVTFYDFVGVKSSASFDEISKALKKRSRALHPDKVRHSFIASRSTGSPRKPGEKRKPGVQVSKGPSQKEIQKFVKEAQERYQRLTVVAGVLRGPARERYDFFLQHGFPRWRGTGYYYSRYRPGLGTVLVGLFVVLGGGAHYLILVTSYKRQREFMERYIKHARKTAWGDEAGLGGIPGLTGSAEPTPSAPAPAEDPDAPMNMNRRQKRELDRQNKKDKSKGKPASASASASGTSTPQRVSGPSGQRRKVTAENGKVLIVDSAGNVYLEEEDEEGNVEEFLLDLDEIKRPTLRDTAVFRLPIWLYRKAFDPFLKGTQPIPSDDVPLTESEKKPIDTKPAAPLPVPEIVLPDMTASQELNGFEMVDSTAIESDMNANIKKRSKKNKK